MTIEEIKTSFDQDRQSLSKEEIKKKYLNKNGLLPLIQTTIKLIPVEQRKSFGQELNKLKTEIEEHVIQEPSLFAEGQKIAYIRCPNGEMYSYIIDISNKHKYRSRILAEADQFHEEVAKILGR